MMRLSVDLVAANIDPDSCAGNSFLDVSMDRGYSEMGILRSREDITSFVDIRLKTRCDDNDAWAVILHEPLPDGSRLEVVQRIRRSRHSMVYLIILSGSQSEADEMESCLATGADAVYFERDGQMPLPEILDYIDSEAKRRGWLT